jgi:hypothetical protein
MQLGTLFFDNESGVLYKVRSDERYWYVYSAIIVNSELYLRYEAKYDYNKFKLVKDVLRFHEATI